MVHIVANEVESTHDITTDLAQFSFTKNQYQQLLGLIQHTNEMSLLCTDTHAINFQNATTSGP